MEFWFSDGNLMVKSPESGPVRVTNIPGSYIAKVWIGINGNASGNKIWREV